MTSLLTLLAGLALLIGGGALLVRGASEIAADLGVSPLVVGLTVVAFGTSAPELVVNAMSASQGATGLAFGNVIGSNISNLALILGVAALVAPLSIEGSLVRREIPLLLLITTIILVMALDDRLEGGPPSIGRSDSVLLFLLFLIFLYVNIADVLRMRSPDRLVADIADNPMIVTQPVSRWRWAMVVGGLAMLFIGGELTVESSIELASAVGVSTAVIGLFVVAVGTSLPELATSVVAAIRRESDLAVGNIVGSNLFNSMIVLPVAGIVRPIPIPEGGILDLVVSWLLVLALFPMFVIGRATLGKPAPIGLLAGYLGYVVFRAAG